MAKPLLTSSLYPEAVPTRPAATGGQVSLTLWWPVAMLIVLVALFDPIRGLSGDVADDLHAALTLAAATAVALGSSFLVGHGQPMRLRTFDILFFLLLFYMASNVAAVMLTSGVDSEGLLRFLRLAAQMCLFYAVFGICSARPALRARCLRLAWVIVLVTCVFGFLQTIGQQTGAFDLFFEYQSLRTYLAVWQVTAQFAEPALLGQFMVAALFIFFSDVDNIRRNWPGLGMIVGTIGLTQSVGALFGLMGWALFLFAYNYRSFLSLRRLDTKFVLLLLSGLAILSFSLLSRISLYELVIMDLPNSGQQRLTSEFVGVAKLVGRDWSEGFLFGVGETMTETVRYDLGAGSGGNALVELLLRYGLVAIVLLGLLFISLGGVINGLFLVAIFALLGQIDGAVAKPYIWHYIALVAVALTGPRPVPQSVPSHERPDRPRPSRVVPNTRQTSAGGLGPGD